MKNRLIMICIGMASLLVACSPVVDNRGHSTEESDFKQIIPKQSTEDDVRALLGSPSASSSYGDDVWYYITERKETSGLRPTEVTDQHVYAIHFDDKHTVTEISEYTKDDSKMVDAVSKTTPSEGNQLTFQQQLFGNFGRFGTPGRAIDPRGLTH